VWYVCKVEGKSNTQSTSNYTHTFTHTHDVNGQEYAVDHPEVPAPVHLPGLVRLEGDEEGVQEDNACCV
jgi:hypothetical protein